MHPAEHSPTTLFAKGIQFIPSTLLARAWKYYLLKFFVFIVILLGWCIPTLAPAQALKNYLSPAESDQRIIVHLQKKQHQVDSLLRHDTPYGGSAGDFSVYSRLLKNGQISLKNLKTKNKRVPEVEQLALIYRDSTGKILALIRHGFAEPRFLKSVKYFFEDETVYAIQIYGLMALGGDNFDEVLWTKFFDINGRILKSDFRCFGQSASCNGIDRYIFPNPKSLSNLLAEWEIP